ncbi:MAG: DUF2142 domain-containing protein [Pseudomonadota bacterium]
MTFLNQKKLGLTLGFGGVFFVFGIIYLGLIPPLQVPDEVAHFQKAVQVSQGIFLGQTEELLPQKLGDFSLYFSNLPFHSAIKVTGEQRKYLSDNLFRKTKWAEEPNKVFHNHISAVYPPTGYLLSGLGIAAARALNQSEVLIFYAGRLMNLLFAVLSFLICFHFSKGFYRFSILIISFLPMFIFEAASFSADSVLNSLALYLVFMASIFENSSFIPFRKQTFFCLVSACFSLTKLLYGFIPLSLLFLRPTSKTNRWQNRSLFFMTAASCFLPIGVWFLTSGHIAQVSRTEPSVNPALQLSYILQNPVHYFLILLKTFITKLWFYAHTGIGSFGWLDTPLPKIITYLYFVFVLFTVIVWQEESRVSKLSRMALLLGFFITFSAFSTAIYLTWTELKSSVVDGVQGRYFIPCLGSLFLAIRSLFPKPKLGDRNLRIWLYSNLSLHGLSFFLIFRRFWMGS